MGDMEIVSCKENFKKNLDSITFTTIKLIMHKCKICHKKTTIPVSEGYDLVFLKKANKYCLACREKAAEEYREIEENTCSFDEYLESKRIASTLEGVEVNEAESISSQMLTMRYTISVT